MLIVSDLEIFAEDEEVEDERMDQEEEDDDEIDDDEEIDESDEVDDEGDMREGGESDISSDEDDEQRPMKQTNGIKKLHPHLGNAGYFFAHSRHTVSLSFIAGIHESNVDLLGIHGAPADSYLQAMNDNIHKKFRRHSQHPASAHTALEDISHSHNQISHPAVQLNGDHKNNIARPAVANGQGLPTTGGGDDDDIVLVSDDDDDDDDDDQSEEEHPETNVIST